MVMILVLWDKWSWLTPSKAMVMIPVLWDKWSWFPPCETKLWSWFPPCEINGHDSYLVRHMVVIPMFLAKCHDFRLLRQIYPNIMIPALEAKCRFQPYESNIMIPILAAKCHDSHLVSQMDMISVLWTRFPGLFTDNFINSWRLTSLV